MTDIHAIKTTVEWVREKSTVAWIFDEENLLLLPPDAAPDNRDYFRRLAITAADRAMQEGCSSLLAGGGNETDDTGDVGFYLGSGDFGNADNVLRVMGLEGQVTTTERKLALLKNEYGFRVEGKDSKVLFVVVGETDRGIWGGLVGAGVWS